METIKLGCDFDGVLCDLDVTKLRLLDYVESMSKENGVGGKKFYYQERKPVLNPYHFLRKDDEFYVISWRELGYQGLGREWLSAHNIYPKEVFFVGERSPLVGVTDPEEIKKKFLAVAEEKAAIINKLKLDIYLDDNLTIVEALDKLCPNTHIIFYSGNSK